MIAMLASAPGCAPIAVHLSCTWAGAWRTRAAHQAQIADLVRLTAGTLRVAAHVQKGQFCADGSRETFLMQKRMALLPAAAAVPCSRQSSSNAIPVLIMRPLPLANNRRGLAALARRWARNIDYDTPHA
jgi:hypothetical protein